jgi:hypothetical protein
MSRHGSCGYLTHSCRPRTQVLVSWSKMSVQLHVEEWDFRRLTNLLTLIRELPSSAFHLAFTWVCKMFTKRCIHTGTQPRLLEVDSSDKPISPWNKRFRIGEWSSFDGGLRPFGVAHGIGRCELKVVGDHHSASVSRNDVMWLMETSSCVGKVVHPCRVKSFRKAVSTVMDDLETDTRS